MFLMSPNDSLQNKTKNFEKDRDQICTLSSWRVFVCTHLQPPLKFTLATNHKYNRINICLFANCFRFIQVINPLLKHALVLMRKLRLWSTFQSLQNLGKDQRYFKPNPPFFNSNSHHEGQFIWPTEFIKLKREMILKMSLGLVMW